MSIYERLVEIANVQDEASYLDSKGPQLEDQCKAAIARRDELMARLDQDVMGLIEALRWQRAVEHAHEWTTYVSEANLVAASEGRPCPFRYPSVLKRNRWLRGMAWAMAEAALERLEGKR